MIPSRLSVLTFYCLLPLFVVFSCPSCNNAPSRKTSDSTKAALVSDKDVLKPTDSLPYRERLIHALQQLQRDVAGKNKAAIAAYFHFPVQSDDLQVFEVGKTFDSAVQRNNYQITETLFLTHFAAVYDNLEMQGLIEMFAQLPLSKLRDTAIKQIQASRSEKVCLHSYNIIIEGKDITLQYGVNTEEEYAALHPDEENECPEYAAFWTFVFDGKQLVFVRHQVAG